jgi:glycosyltransferase involved in cell wall biosynthesis
MSRPNGVEIDQLISLQFPGYGIQHPDHRVWVMHQHRAVYDLYNQQSKTPELRLLKERVEAFDQQALNKVKKCFANSKNVANRLRKYNGIQAEPLYHPPPNAERFINRENLGYIYCPSRIETLKRQDLLIEAVAKLKNTPFKFLLSGVGGQYHAVKEKIERYHLQDKVKLLGHVSEAEKIMLYAHASAVFFAPYDEDYGYVTLEAMLSKKPVITCRDSGGVLEFIQDGQNGFVIEPKAEVIADLLSRLGNSFKSLEEMGQSAYESYQAKNINWNHVVENLTT